MTNKYLIILLLSICSLSVKGQEMQRDSIMNVFFYNPQDLVAEKGTVTECYFDLNFIQATFDGEQQIKEMADILQCDLEKVESGTISTQIQSLIDDKETMILYYFIIVFNKSDSWIKKYYKKLSKVEYDTVRPVMEAPFTCYNFLTGNKLIILAHKGFSGFHYDYNNEGYSQMD